MNEQWKQLKDTIVAIRNNNRYKNEDVTHICHFLANYMDILEDQMQEPCEYVISRQDMLDAIGHGTTYTSEELQKIIKGLPDAAEPIIKHNYVKVEVNADGVSN